MMSSLGRKLLIDCKIVSKLFYIKAAYLKDKKHLFKNAYAWLAIIASVKTLIVDANPRFLRNGRIYDVSIG